MTVFDGLSNMHCGAIAREHGCGLEGWGRSGYNPHPSMKVEFEISTSTHLIPVVQGTQFLLGRQYTALFCLIEECEFLLFPINRNCAPCTGPE